MLPERITRRGAVCAMLAAGAVALLFADLSVTAHDPWGAITRMIAGLLSPDFMALEQVWMAIVWTVAFAVTGVGLGATVGLICAPFYQFAPLRWLLIGLRSVHELFWALMLMQITGLSPLTGVLAIALPYAGVFAKVFAELIEEADPRPALWLPRGVDPVSRFLYARVPFVLRDMWSYLLYRIECGLRSSAVLGFIGLPTLGFQLDTFFRQGQYHAVGAVLLCYVALVATIRLWMRGWLAPLWLAASITSLAMIRTPPMGEGALWRFLSHDIVPAPLRRGGAGADAFWGWLEPLLWAQAIPGALTTLVVAQIALVLTGGIAFIGFGPAVRRVSGRGGAAIARACLILLRTLPEYMLGYIFLQILGPSMLPVVLALALHNGAIIAHLLSREAENGSVPLRQDAPRGLTFWGYELAPRLFGRFVALCLYRWEMILRETAVMGLLGVMTLGFFLDSALAELRLDRGLVMICATALMTLGVDALSRTLRSRFGAGRFQRDHHTNRSNTTQSDALPAELSV
jgi:phosphonate transport system permease protein